MDNFPCTTSNMREVLHIQAATPFQALKRHPQPQHVALVTGKLAEARTQGMSLLPPARRLAQPACAQTCALLLRAPARHSQVFSTVHVYQAFKLDCPHPVRTAKAQVFWWKYEVQVIIVPRPGCQRHTDSQTSDMSEP